MLRAEAVKKYLVSRGIDPNRIKTVGFGKRKPVAPNDTEFGRRLNRRTEIVILSK
ncbi:MAG: OmpA family protein [Candidatus Kapaibacteriota bacterium]